MYKYLLSTFLIANLANCCCSFTIQPIEFELLDNKFRLSIPNDPDIKWVSFHVNINKEFTALESGQLIGTTSMPIDNKWSYEFDRTLKDSDIVYIWLSVQHNRLIFRDKQAPISVEAFKSGKPNYRLTTPASGLERRVVTDAPPKPLGVPCHSTVTKVPASYGGPYCRGDLIFSDDFDTLNNQYWTNEVRLSSKLDGAEFILYNGTVGVDNGVLEIKASLSTQNVNKDSIDLGPRCTSLNVDKECHRAPRGVLILPPIVSGRLSTRNYLNFTYGRVVVKAKMPIGDWLYPLISLQPSTLFYGDQYKSGEMRIAYIHGNRELIWQNKNIDGARLYSGAIVEPDAESRYQFMKDVTLPNVKHFGDDFHLYTLTWTPDHLIMDVDGNEYGRIDTDFKKVINEPMWNKGEDNAPLDQMFYIALGLAAGGGNDDFPDVKDKPWNNTDPRRSLNFYRSRRKWSPTWTQPSLQVDYIRVYAV